MNSKVTTISMQNDYASGTWLDSKNDRVRKYVLCKDLLGDRVLIVFSENTATQRSRKTISVGDDSFLALIHEANKMLIRWSKEGFKEVGIKECR